MFHETGNVDAPLPERFVPDRELSRVQLAKERVHVDVFAGEDVNLDVFGPVFEATFTVSEEPKANKKQPRMGAAFC